MIGAFLLFKFGGDAVEFAREFFTNRKSKAAAERQADINTGVNAVLRSRAEQVDAGIAKPRKTKKR
jgi:hypothetical protein